MHGGMSILYMCITVDVNPAGLGLRASFDKAASSTMHDVVIANLKLKHIVLQSLAFFSV